MFLKNVKYILSAPSKEYYPKEKRKEICILGRSNVGKSTFINKICNYNGLAKVSKTPGYTKYLNYFDVDGKYYLVDSPGYGYARLNRKLDKQFEKMMKSYIYENDNLKCCVMLVDAKVSFTDDDVLLLEMLHDADVNVQIIASKEDKTNQSLRSKLKKDAKEILNDDEYENMLLYSSLDDRTISKVVDRIIEIYEN